MKLILCSWSITQNILKYLNFLCDNKKSVLTIIPSDSKHPKSKIFFNSLVEKFNSIWIEKIKYYPVDNWIYNENIYKESDIIYLSWWDTDYFIKNIKKNWDYEMLKKFVDNWWILMWLSAWSIIMTPNINIDNSNEKWLNLTSFEFFPHYTENNDDFLIEYSKKCKNLIYSLEDDSSIIVNNKEMYFINSNWIFIYSNWLKQEII